jgi:hypothetical protein
LAVSCIGWATRILVERHRLRVLRLYWLPMLRLRSAVIAGVLSTALLSGHAQGKGISAMHHAHGTFTVKVQPLTPELAPGISRYSIDKEIQGDLEAATKGEMLTAGNPKQGAAGYVAMELVTGTLQGKHGSFALQHIATMDQNGPKMTVTVVPGSGTAELTGIAGTFAITIANGQHSYDLDYTLPE